jgi:hypothetical protein
MSSALFDGVRRNKPAGLSVIAGLRLFDQMTTFYQLS